MRLPQAMLEDKLRATDNESTNDAIERQVANESYLEYIKEMDKRNNTVGDATN